MPSCASGSFFTLPSIEDRPLGPWGLRPQLAGGPPDVGSTWPLVLGTGLTPAVLCSCSNGILYQYPDRTDVTPLLSVNMG